MDAADIVLLSPHLERLGRLCMPDIVASIAPLSHGPCGALVVALRNGRGLVIDAAERNLVPLRRKNNAGVASGTRISEGARDRSLHDVDASPTYGSSSQGAPCQSRISPLAELLAPPCDGRENVGNSVVTVAVSEASPSAAFVALQDGGLFVWSLAYLEEDTDFGPVQPLEVYRAPVGCAITCLATFPSASNLRHTRTFDDESSDIMVLVGHDSGSVAVVTVPPTALLRHDSSMTWAGRDRRYHRDIDVMCPSHLCCDYGRVLDVKWTALGRIIYCGEDDSVYCADLRRSVSRFRLGSHESFAAGVAVRGEHVLSAGLDGQILLWSMRSDMDQLTFPDFAEDDGLVIASTDPGKTFWQVEWPQPRVVYVSSCESHVGRCLLHRIDLVDRDTSDEDAESGLSADSRGDSRPLLG